MFSYVYEHWLEMLRIIFFLLCLNGSVCWLEWIYSNNINDETDSLKQKKDTNEHVKTELVKIPFEIESAEEKFLQEAKYYTDISFKDLDLCHQKLILHLKSSCASMTEEDLSKLSVNLLNCQAAAEGRTTFPCTDSMPLQACTKNMDQSTWNAYLIISNRARSVCFSIRQHHFRISAQMTVDKLMSTAEQQLIALLSLKEGQERLSKVTENTLETVSIKQKDLLEQQLSLKQAQDTIHGQISSNFRVLIKEKALIAAGQREVALIMEEINKKLMNAEKQLSSLESKRHQNFHLVLKDLAAIQKKHANIWDKIDNSTKHILYQHSLALKHYELSLENLQKINDSINYLMLLIVTTKTEVDGKLAWLTSLAGGAGLQLSLITTCILHLIYFLLGALAVVFLQAPRLTRITLLVVVPCNALLAVHYGKSLDLVSMVILIATISLGPLVLKLSPHYPVNYQWLKRKYHILSSTKKRNFIPIQPLPNATMNENSESDSNESIGEIPLPSVTDPMFTLNNTRDDSISFERLKLDSSITDTPISMKSSHFHSNLNSSLIADDPPNLTRHRLLHNEKEHRSLFHHTPSPNSSRSSTPLRYGTPPNHKTCRAINKKGHRCRLNHLQGELYCHLHKEFEKL